SQRPDLTMPSSRRRRPRASARLLPFPRQSPAAERCVKQCPRILILGLPYFGRMLVEVLSRKGWDARFAAHPGRDLRGWGRLLPRVARAHVVYLIGSRMDRGSPQEWLMRLRSRPTVIHWVGTDVL